MKLLLLSIPVVGYLTLSAFDLDARVEKFHGDIVDGVNYSVNPPTGKTGAPIDGDCTDCHTGSTLPADGTIGVSFSGPGDMYYPDSTYTVNIVLLGGSTKNGFEATMLDMSNNMAGSFTAGGNSAVASAGGVDYIRQTASAGISNWTFEWTAPSTDVGDVRFYYAYNKTNDNGNNSGDEIYLGQHDLSIASDLSVNRFEKMDADYKVTFNPTNDMLHIHYSTIEDDNVTFFIQDLNGRLIERFDMGQQKPGNYSEKLQVTKLQESGIYLVSAMFGNQVFTRKVYLQ